MTCRSAGYFCTAKVGFSGMKRLVLLDAPFYHFKKNCSHDHSNGLTENGFEVRVKDVIEVE